MGRLIKVSVCNFLAEHIKYLRILAAFIIVLAFGINAGAAPAYALSEKEAALEKLKEEAINFHEVTPGLYRSGLIPEKSAPLLNQLGIKTVISFDNNKKRAKREAETLKSLGINLVSIPWSGWDLPDGAVIKRTLEVIETADAKPVLVHCKHGQERTGVAIACWRIANESWPPEKAYQEMKAYGFRSFRYGHLKKYVYDFAKARGVWESEISNPWEQMKTNVLSFFYQLRKLNLFVMEEKSSSK